MAETKTEICNGGLRKIGAETIDSFDTGTSVNARHCQNIFPILFDATLRSYDFTCARARKQFLSTDATTPAFGERFQHVLPTDPWCLRPLQLEDRTDGFRIEGRLLLTDLSVVNLLYTKRITDMSEVDALLSQVMVYLMAVELSPVIKANEKLPLEVARFVFDVWMPLARGASGREGVVEVPQSQKVNRLIDQASYV